MAHWLRRTAVLALGTLALAACSQQLSADEIVARMEQAQQDTRDLHATVAIEFVTNERNGSLLVESWSKVLPGSDAAGRPVQMQRAEVRESAEPRLRGLTFVSNGDQFWVYTPAEQTVLTGSKSELTRLREGSGLGAASGPMAAVESLPALLQPALDQVDVALLPNEQVGGRDAWKLKLTPKAQEGAPSLAGIAGTTLWVDPQRALPLKAQIDASDAGEGTIEARSLESNTGLDEALFRFEVPQGTRVVQAAEIQRAVTPQKLSLDEARAQVDFPLLAPESLPAGTTLVEVQLFQQGGSPAVVQNYAGPVSFSLVQSRADVSRDQQPPAGSQSSEVAVRGVQATLITGGQQGSLLRWQEEGVTRFVAGTLTAEQALAVAESLR